jgi:hypothetical protein
MGVKRALTVHGNKVASLRSTSLSVVPTWPVIQAKVMINPRLKSECQLTQISSISG